MPEVDTPNNGEREFETGNDEFFKAGSQVNYLNAKRTYDAYQDLDLLRARQHQVEQTRVNQIAEQALQNAVSFQAAANQQMLRLVDLASDSFWNPVTNGAGMNLTAGAVPSNRVTDTAAAGAAVASEAVAAAVAKQVDATIAPVLATLQQMVQALTTATTSIANVVAQAQPKA